MNYPMSPQAKTISLRHRDAWKLRESDLMNDSLIRLFGLQILQHIFDKLIERNFPVAVFFDKGQAVPLTGLFILDFERCRIALYFSLRVSGIVSDFPSLLTSFSISSVVLFCSFATLSNISNEPLESVFLMAAESFFLVASKNFLKVAVGDEPLSRLQPIRPGQ